MFWNVLYTLMFWGAGFTALYFCVKKSGHWSEKLIGYSFSVFLIAAAGNLTTQFFT